MTDIEPTDETLPASPQAVADALQKQRTNGMSRAQTELDAGEKARDIYGDELDVARETASATEIAMAERQRRYAEEADRLRHNFDTDMAELRSRHTGELAQIADIETALEAVNEKNATLRRKGVRVP